VQHHEVDLLHGARARGVHADRVVAEVDERVRTSAREPPHGEATLARNAATADIQKWLWTRSGVHAFHARASASPKSSMKGSMRSFEMAAAGPASTCSTTTFGANGTRTGSAGSSRRVYMTTS
jgi:hypothetical protein